MPRPPCRAEHGPSAEPARTRRGADRGVARGLVDRDLRADRAPRTGAGILARTHGGIRWCFAGARGEQDERQAAMFHATSVYNSYTYAMIAMLLERACCVWCAGSSPLVHDVGSVQRIHTVYEWRSRGTSRASTSSRCCAAHLCLHSSSDVASTLPPPAMPRRTEVRRATAQNAMRIHVHNRCSSTRRSCASC